MIAGEVESAFEPVRRAFQANFEERGEVGAAVSVYYDGRPVVNLWGGVADAATERPWQQDTLQVVFSATKGLTAACFLLLEHRGGVDLDAPVASVWPEIAESLGSTSIRTILNHRGGVCALDRPYRLEDVVSGRVEALMAKTRPRWAPGSDQGYHAVTYGIYAASIFKRLTQKSIGTYLREEIAGPLGADVHIGLPPDQRHRTSTLIPVPHRTYYRNGIPQAILGRSNEGRFARAMMRNGDTRHAFGELPDIGKDHLIRLNDYEVQRHEMPWVGAMCTAEGLARVYAAWAQGGQLGKVKLVDQSAIEPLVRRQSWSDMDRVLRKPIGWSQGFLKEETNLFSPNKEAFGHAGAGGALGWADPVAKISIGYTPNRMDWRIRSPRALALCKAVYESLGQ